MREEVEYACNRVCVGRRHDHGCWDKKKTERQEGVSDLGGRRRGFFHQAIKIAPKRVFLPEPTMINHVEYLYYLLHVPQIADLRIQGLTERYVHTQRDRIRVCIFLYMYIFWSNDCSNVLSPADEVTHSPLSMKKRREVREKEEDGRNRIQYILVSMDRGSGVRETVCLASAASFCLLVASSPFLFLFLFFFFPFFSLLDS